MQLKPFGQLFKGSWEIYQKKINTLAMLMVIPFVANLVFILMGGKHVETNAAGVHATSNLGAVGLLVGLILVFVSLWVQIAMVKAIDGQATKPDVAKLLSKSTSLILPLLLVGILTGLAVIGGLILLIIPGIIFGVWFAFGSYTLILEDKRSTEALKASKALVDGRWWDVFGRFILLGLSLAGLGILASIVFSIFGDTIHAVLSAGFSSFFITPIGTIFSYLLYKELKQHHAPKPAAE